MTYLARPSRRAVLFEALMLGLGAGAGRLTQSLLDPPWWKQPAISIGAIGDSVIELQYARSLSYPEEVGTPLIWMGCAFVHWAAMVSGRRFWTDIYAVEGYSGKRTDEILSLMLPSGATVPFGGSKWGPEVGRGVRACRPRYAFEISGHNDLSQMVSATAIASNRARIWMALRASGVEPIALSVLPRDPPASEQQEVAAANSAISQAAKAAGVHFIDITSAVSDGTGRWKSEYCRIDTPHTGLHPSNEASHAIAAVIAANLETWLPAWRKLPYADEDLAVIEHFDGRRRELPLLSNLGTGKFAAMQGWGPRYEINQASVAIRLPHKLGERAPASVAISYPPPLGGDGYSDRWGPDEGVATLRPGIRIAFFGRVAFDAGDAGDQILCGLQGRSQSGAVIWAFKNTSLGNGRNVFTRRGASLSLRDFYQELVVPPDVTDARFWNEVRTSITSVGVHEKLGSVGILRI